MNEKTLSVLIRDLLGILAVAFSLFAFISLLTYSSGDPSLNTKASSNAEVANLGGIVGAYIADGLAQIFGGGAFFFPVITLIVGWAVIRGKKFHHWPLVFCSGLVFLAGVCALFAVRFGSDPFFEKSIPTGGMAGATLGKFLVQWLNPVGATLILSTMLVVSLLVMTRLSINSLIDGAVEKAKAGFQGAGRVLAFFKSIIGEWVDQWRAYKKERAERIPQRDPIIVTSKIFDPEEQAQQKFRKKKEEQDPFAALERPRPRKSRGGYRIPPKTLLDDPPEPENSEKFKQEILASSSILEQKLADFGIEGRVVQVLPGPVITLYEFEPAPGVKVSRIISLSDDLALAMRAINLRILAPVPGKPVVGIEIPNRERETVYYKEIISSKAFSKSISKLSLAIGKDNIGRPVVQDLATIPHLLIAGSTGSGKSVGLNAMICSILLNATPDEVKMIMIDPKMLELSMYDGIPHLISPVVTNPKKATAALQWAVAEMESRYKLMAEMEVRNISGYNEAVEQLQQDYEEECKNKNRGRKTSNDEDCDFDEEEELDEPPEKFPYIVILIDELADLMMVACKGVEECLTRLAQMARAAGIHLIVATQRPSVDVLTGIIKANFPARISFKLTSRVDSRTILDTMGAEKLLGQGDMLFLPPGTTKLERIHGPMVSDDEIKRIVDFIKSQKEPEYKEDIFQTLVAEIKEKEENEEYDEKYDEAVALVARERQASISYIQRRLRVGYNRAARIIETMEQEGVVGPSDGIKPRDVYVKPILFE